MKQVVGTPQGVQVIEVPTPACGPGQVLMSVRYSVISPGTELASIRHTQAPLWQRALQNPNKVAKVVKRLFREGLGPTVRQVRNKLAAYQNLGYSCAGVVLAVGEGVRDLRPGDRVAGAGAGHANHAEIVAIPRQLVVLIPQQVDFREAASVTLGAIALQGVRRASPTLGETFLVLGLGLLGQLSVQLLLADGCRVLAHDPDPDRLALAKQMGAFPISGDGDLLAQILQQTQDMGVDGVLVCAATASSDPTNLALQACRRKGRVVIVGAVGLDLKRDDFYQKELDVLMSTSYGPGRYDPAYEDEGHDYPAGYVRWTENRNLEAYLRLVKNRKVRLDTLLQTEFALDQAPQAYHALQTDKPLGVLLRYQEAPLAQRVDLDRPLKAGPLGLAVIGAGAFAQGVLMPIVRRLPQVHIRGVVNQTGPKARQVGQHYGAGWCATDAQVAFDDAETNVVVIATRHHLHAEQVIAAARSGKAIFVEKPLCIREDELAAVTQAVHESGVPCMVGFNRRFAPLSLELKQRMETLPGPTLIHYRVNAGALPPHHWINDPRIGGGRLVGEGCHFIDWMCWLIGEWPVDLQIVGRGDGENFCLSLQYPDQSVANLVYTSLGHADLGKERIEVYRAGSAAILDNFQELTIHGPLAYQKRLGTTDKGHQRELELFIQALAEGKPLPIPFDEAAETTRWTLKAQALLQPGHS